MAAVVMVVVVVRGRFVISPLDVVKIRLQLQAHDARPKARGGLQAAVAAAAASDGPTYRGIAGTMRQIVAHEGVSGLWKGNIPAELLYVCYGPVQFVTFKECALGLQRLAPHTTADLRHLLAGSVAGAAATVATYPLDLLRTRFAAQGLQRVFPSLPRRSGRSASRLRWRRYTRRTSTRCATSTATRACAASTAALAPA